ncbi:MAG: hypothetical protein M3Q33_14860 [Acidobacteriota bacterium]|nr:hypothetical protein [Acidobacteriota bacterium]
MIYKKFNTKLNQPLMFAVALFITTISVLAQRPTESPTPGQGNGSGALQSVATDSTLTGNGTTTAPLGLANNGVSTGKIADGAVNERKIADGAITTSKLATQNAPQSGQVLTFNGTGLSWQTPAANNFVRPLRIVDSLGNDVGIPNMVNNTGYGVAVFRYLESENMFIYFHVNPAGVQEIPTYYYSETTDCTGAAYLFNYTNDFAQASIRKGDNVYYPTGSLQTRNIRSGKVANNPCKLSNFTSEFYSTATIPVSNFGTPPFKLSR